MDDLGSAVSRTDAEYLLMPPVPMTPSVMFLCTFVGKVSGSCGVPSAAFTAAVSKAIGPVDMDRVRAAFETRGCAVGPERTLDGVTAELLSVNSNWGHAGDPRYIKTSTAAVRRTSRGVPRQRQGDGSSFNSSVEVVFQIRGPDFRENKIYKLKCFPSTPQMGVQVPGVLCEDLWDGIILINVFAAVINGLGIVASPAAAVTSDVTSAVTSDVTSDVTSAAPSAAPLTWRVSEIGRNMMNYKWALNFGHERLRLNIEAVRAALAEGVVDRGDMPHSIQEVVNNESMTSCKFILPGADTGARVNFRPTGKINVLGEKTTASAQQIYGFISRLFTERWEQLVSIRPLSDAELKKGALAAARISSAAAPAAVPAVAPNAAVPAVAAVPAAVSTVAPPTAVPAVAPPAVDMTDLWKELGLA